MTDPTKKPETAKPKTSTEAGQASELDDKALESISGGVRGGDEDLEDLEVERLRQRIR